MTRHGGRRWRALLLATSVLTAGACKSPGAPSREPALSKGTSIETPSFTASTTTAPRTAVDGGSRAGDASPTSAAPPSDARAGESGGSTSAVPGAEGEGDQVPQELKASVDDARGDVKAGLERPPAWVDLVSATVTRSDAFSLRLRFADSVPERTDADHTMNVASFFDTNGDGTVDYQVWANLSEGGWGGAYFDDGPGEGRNRFGDDSGVEAVVDDGALVMRFPPSHLAGASAFRWSVATEWGAYANLGSALMATDSAPDFDGAPFPS